jgi:hypothetical protein
MVDGDLSRPFPETPPFFYELNFNKPKSHGQLLSMFETPISPECSLVSLTISQLPFRESVYPVCRVVCRKSPKAV